MLEQVLVELHVDMAQRKRGIVLVGDALVAGEALGRGVECGGNVIGNLLLPVFRSRPAVSGADQVTGPQVEVGKHAGVKYGCVDAGGRRDTRGLLRAGGGSEQNGNAGESDGAHTSFLERSRAGSAASSAQRRGRVTPCCPWYLPFLSR